MNILLIYPPIDNMVKGPISSDITNISGFPPLHLLYIASNAELISGVTIKIIDCRLEKFSYEGLDKKIKQENPDIVGISVNSFMLIDALNTAEIVKKHNPKTKVVFGGIHPTIYPKETIQHKNVDILVLGEAEFAFKTLIEHIQANKPYEAIPGIVSKQTNDIDNVKPQVINDLDSIRPPAWHLVDCKLYTREHKPVMWLYTSRGCIGKCTFCYIPERERKFRYHSVKYIISHLKDLIEKYNLNEFYIADDCFTVKKKRVLEFCEQLRKNNINANWGLVSRIDTLSEDLLKAMSDAGCTNIYLGIETGDQEIQRIIKKNLNLEKVREIVNIAQKYGLHPHGYVMVGHPKETKTEILKTIKFIKSIKLSGIAGGAAIFQPYPNTFSYLEGLQTRLIKKDYWREFAKSPSSDFRFQFWNENFSNEELLKWQKKINNSFYFRPIIVYRTFKEAIKTGRLKSKIKSFFIFLKTVFS